MVSFFRNKKVSQGNPISVLFPHKKVRKGVIELHQFSKKLAINGIHSKF